VRSPTPPAGSGGGLPVTGARSALVGGTGLAVLVLGGVLFVVGRRRRVVVVAPEERS
jgi:LPXTG-motif cell wall-anchored protein